jgi:hypothetical protein
MPPIKLMMSKQPPQRQSEIWNAITDAVRKHQDAKSGAATLQNKVIYITAKR